MNIINWKGVSSDTITGLMICELPPITKPPLRFREIEIDGRDGSIIEELGYGSYDKTLTIGLTRNFDINAVISYFTGSGNLILSNEPDKYYKAQIIGQIDFERLIRFRTATVKFRVQPYKYQVNEYVEEFVLNEANVQNNGNTIAKPLIEIIGTGTVSVYKNRVQIFSYTFPTGESTVTIDSEQEDAYNGSVLKNRNMTGEFLTLDIGNNTISYIGEVYSFKITARRRWV